MKKAAGLLASLLLILATAVGTVAQTSDYEIIQTFKQSRQSLLDSIKAVREPAACEALGREVDQLEANYAQHRRLLADGLYPESFDGAITGLRDQLLKSAERIALVEESKQDKQTIQVISAKAAVDAQKIETISRENVEFRASIEKLNQEVQYLSTRISALSEENAGLVSQIKTLQAESRKDKESIAKLKELTEKLKANIRDRDELVLRMMDSMFGEYSKAGMTDAQRQNLFVNVQGNDYVGKIVSTIDENARYAESTILSAEDAKLVVEEQRKLSGKWGQIKESLGRIYPDEQSRVRDLATVDSRLADWKRSVDLATWKGLHQAFAGQGIAIGDFRNGEEFSTQLLAYLDQQTQNPSREAYRAFKERVWDSPVKDTWLPLIPVEELSQQQRSEFDSRIALWEKAVSALFWRWVLIGGFGVAVLAGVFVVLLVARKRRNQASTPPA